MTVITTDAYAKKREADVARRDVAQATYVVTVRGKPVAELRPLAAKSLDERRQAEVEDAMLRMEELARRIALAWTSPRGAVELVQEQRR